MSSKHADQLRGQPPRPDHRFHQLGDLPDWLKIKIRGQLNTWRAGKARTCMHNPTYGAGNSVFLVAWKPDLVVCLECPHLVALAPHDPEDRRCDSCGRLTEGTADDRTYSARINLAGGVLYGFAVCTACRVAMT